MSLELHPIFNRRISSFFSLLLVFLFAFTLGTIIIVKSKNLKKLEEPFIVDYYMSIVATTSPEIMNNE